MNHTLLIDVRFSHTFVVGARILRDAFTHAHQLSGQRPFALDFPMYKSAKHPGLAHMSPFGSQIRLFGDMDHLEAVQEKLANTYEDAVAFPEGGTVSAGSQAIQSYAQVTATRPRKSGERAAQRLKKHLEKRGIPITREIAEGSPDYRYPDAPFLVYRSQSNGCRFSFFVHRKTTMDKLESALDFDRFGFSLGGWVPVYNDYE